MCSFTAVACILKLKESKLVDENGSTPDQRTCNGGKFQCFDAWRSLGRITANAIIYDIIVNHAGTMRISLPTVGNEVTLELDLTNSGRLAECLDLL